MTPNDFIRGYLNMQPERNYNPDTLKLLAGAADQTKDGYVEINFLAFLDVTCSPFLRSLIRTL